MTTGVAEPSMTGDSMSSSESANMTFGGLPNMPASATPSQPIPPHPTPTMPTQPRQIPGPARAAVPELSLLSAELTITILQATATLALLSGIVLGLHRLAEAASDPASEFGVGVMLTVLAGPAVGAVAGAALLGLAVLLELLLVQAGILRRLTRTLEDLGPGLESYGPADKTRVNAVHDLLEQVVDSVGELRDVMLMDEAERRAHSRAIIEFDQRRRLEEIQSHIRTGDTTAALKAIALFEVRYPTSPEPTRLRQVVRDAQRQRRLEEANRLADAAEQAARAERWREAFLLSSDLLAKYPDTPPADFARSGLDTLRRNAEIETRREWEDRLREHINHQRWGEAVSVAERLVSLYPDSPQAALLREKLPQLRQQAGL